MHIAQRELPVVHFWRIPHSLNGVMNWKALVFLVIFLRPAITTALLFVVLRQSS